MLRVHIERRSITDALKASINGYAKGADTVARHPGPPAGRMYPRSVFRAHCETMVLR